MKNEPLEYAGLLAAGRGALERDFEGLDDLAVLNSRGTCRFARAAIKAELEMPPHTGSNLQATVGNRAHQVNSSARAVIFVARLNVGRTARRAEPAVDALLIPHVRDLLRQPLEVDRRRSRRLVMPGRKRGSF